MTVVVQVGGCKGSVGILNKYWRNLVMEKTSVSVSETVSVGYTREGRGEKVHVFGRESYWGPITLCGHRMALRAETPRDKFLNSERACGHCKRKVKKL